jgi:hypothetical protein
MIIKKRGGVGWKNWPLFGTDILPPEGDPGLGPSIFLFSTIYTWTQFEKSTDLFLNHQNVFSLFIRWLFADYRPIILIILIIVDYRLIIGDKQWGIFIMGNITHSGDDRLIIRWWSWGSPLMAGSKSCPISDLTSDPYRHFLSRLWPRGPFFSTRGVTPLNGPPIWIIIQ